MATSKKKSETVSEKPDAEDVLANILANDDGGVDLLGAMLDTAMEEDVAAESGIGVDGAGISMDFVAIPQPKSARYSIQEDEDSPPQNQAGKIFVGNREQNKEPDAYYKSGAFQIMLIDTVMHRDGRMRKGGRLMWPVKADGQRDMSGGVACASRNGIAPIPIYLGKELLHPDLGIKLHIGMTFNARGAEIPVLDGHICDVCPFAKWGAVKDADGNDSPALCKRNTRFVVYDIQGDRLAQFSGGNLGVEWALRGRRAGQQGNQKDGTTLEGVERPFLPNGERHIVIPRSRVDELRPNQWHGFSLHSNDYGVIGLANSLEDADDYLKMRAYDLEGKKNERFFEILEANTDLVGVILSVPTYPIAPNGKPEHVGEMTLVYPVKVMVVENDFKLDGAPNPTYVPKFVVDEDHPMTALAYANYLAAQQTYYKREADTGQNLRDIFLGMEDVEFATQRMTQLQQSVLVSGAAAGALGAGQPGVSDEEFEKFDAPDDDIIEDA